MRFAHKAIAVHRPHLDALVSHGNPMNKFEVVMNTPDPAVFLPRTQLPNNGDGFKAVYHGTIGRRHGLELAIRALAIARSDIPSLSLTIIGGGDDLPRLLRIVSELDLKDQILFRNGVPLDELPALLEDADVGIVPLRRDVFTEYMLPVKLLEYAAIGVPVITTRTKTIETYFDDGMVEFISGESEHELARKLVELYKAPRRRACLANNAAAFIAQNNWSAMKHTYFHLIDSLSVRQRTCRSIATPPASDLGTNSRDGGTK